MLCSRSDTRCASRIAGDTKKGRLVGCQASSPPSSRSASRAYLARSGGDGMIGPSPRNDRPDGEGCQAVATPAPAPLATPEPAGERPAAPGPRQPCAMDRLETVSSQRQLLAGCECSSCRNSRHIADLTWHARTTGLELGVPKVERRLTVFCGYSLSHQQPHQYWASSISWANSVVKPGARE